MLGGFCAVGREQHDPPRRHLGDAGKNLVERKRARFELGRRLGGGIGRQQEVAAAIAADKERRAELRAKFDELATDELERLWATGKAPWKRWS